MSRCLVDVEFLYNEKDYIFAKHILVCGITKNGASLVKSIKYNYPTISKEPDSEDNDNEDKDTKPLNVFKNGLKNGNLEYPRTDLELSRTLAKFSTVIVKNQTEKEFINNYINTNVNIVQVSNKKQ